MKDYACCLDSVKVWVKMSSISKVCDDIHEDVAQTIEYMIKDELKFLARILIRTYIDEYACSDIQKTEQRLTHLRVVFINYTIKFQDNKLTITNRLNRKTISALISVYDLMRLIDNLGKTIISFDNSVNDVLGYLLKEGVYHV